MISPAIPVVGKIPVTFTLPEPSLDGAFEFYDQANQALAKLD